MRMNTEILLHQIHPQFSKYFMCDYSGSIQVYIYEKYYLILISTGRSDEKWNNIIWVENNFPIFLVQRILQIYTKFLFWFIFKMVNKFSQRFKAYCIILKTMKL